MKIKMRFHTVLPVTLAVSTLKSQCDASFLKKIFSNIYIQKKEICFIPRNFRQMNPMYVLYNDI